LQASITFFNRFIYLLFIIDSFAVVFDAFYSDLATHTARVCVMRVTLRFDIIFTRASYTLLCSSLDSISLLLIENMHLNSEFFRFFLLIIIIIIIFISFFCIIFFLFYHYFVFYLAIVPFRFVTGGHREGGGGGGHVEKYDGMYLRR
jgi:hypothetical protein